MLRLLRKLDFLRNLLGGDESAAKAKERLRIVLIQDQSNISSELLNTLRNEMIGVVSRYLEIDLDHLEMGIERKEGAVALAASIPIVRIRREGRALVPQDDMSSENGSTAERVSTAMSNDAPAAVRDEAAVAVAVAPPEAPARSKGERRRTRSRRNLR